MPPDDFSPHALQCSAQLANMKKVSEIENKSFAHGHTAGLNTKRSITT